MLEQVSIIKQVCIGLNRYQGRNGSAMYINCLESYPADDPDSSGEYSLQHRCDYNDFAKFEKNPPSFFNPVVVTCEGKFEVFAGNKQFTVSRIVSVEPYKASTKPAAVAKAS